MKGDFNISFENINFGDKKTNESHIEDGNAEIQDELYKVYKEKTYKVIEKIKGLGLPNENEQLRLITMRSFNTIAFIELIAQKEIITEMMLIIFAINISAAKTLIELYKSGRIHNIKLIISSIRNAGHVIKSRSVKMLSEVKDIDMIFVNSHAKISALKTQNGNHYIIEGSGNYSYNGRIEQYVIDNDKKLFDFTCKWVREMEMSMSRYKDYTHIIH